MLTGGSKSCRFFLPLCGKAGDLVYLYNEGKVIVNQDKDEVVTDPDDI